MPPISNADFLYHKPEERPPGGCLIRTVVLASVAKEIILKSLRPGYVLHKVQNEANFLFQKEIHSNNIGKGMSKTKQDCCIVNNKKTQNKTIQDDMNINAVSVMINFRLK